MVNRPFCRGRPVDAGEEAEVLVERAVLLHYHDDMLDAAWWRTC